MYSLFLVCVWGGEGGRKTKRVLLLLLVSGNPIWHEKERERARGREWVSEWSSEEKRFTRRVLTSLVQAGHNG